MHEPAVYYGTVDMPGKVSYGHHKLSQTLHMHGDHTLQDLA